MSYFRKRITVRLDDELLQKLDRLRAEQGLTRSEMVRLILEVVKLKRQNRPPMRSTLRNWTKSYPR